MKDFLKKLKAWQNVMERQEERREEEEKIDLREDGQSAGVDTNGDGIVDGEDQHYSPDKKQGSDKEKKEAEHHRSFHR